MKIVVIYPKYIISSFVACGSGMMKSDNKNRSHKKLSKQEIRPAQKSPDQEKIYVRNFRTSWGWPDVLIEDGNFGETVPSGGYEQSVPFHHQGGRVEVARPLVDSVKKKTGL